MILIVGMMKWVARRMDGIETRPLVSVHGVVLCLVGEVGLIDLSFLMTYTSHDREAARCRIFCAVRDLPTCGISSAMAVDMLFRA